MEIRDSQARRRAKIIITSKLFALGDLLVELNGTAELDAAATLVLNRVVEEICALVSTFGQEGAPRVSPEISNERMADKLETLRRVTAQLHPKESTRGEGWRRVREKYELCRAALDPRSRDLHESTTLLSGY